MKLQMTVRNARHSKLREVRLAEGRTDKPIIRLAAAAKRMVRERIQDRWKKQWESERTAQPTKRLLKWPDKKNLTVVRMLVETAIIDHDTDALNAYCAPALPVQDQCCGLRQMPLWRGLPDSEACPATMRDVR